MSEKSNVAPISSQAKLDMALSEIPKPSASAPASSYTPDAHQVWRMAEKSKLRYHKEAFRTLLCGHLIPDLAGIALDYFWVLMFVRSIHLALSF